MEWNNKGNERKPAMKFSNDVFGEYFFEMEKNNINYDIVEINVPKIVCLQGLANHMIPNYNGPAWRAKEGEVAKVDGVDGPTHCDINVALFLVDIMKQDREKQAIKVRLSKNVQAIMRDAGVL